MSHERIERGQLPLVQKARLMFHIGSKAYLNGDQAIQCRTKEANR